LLVCLTHARRQTTKQVRWNFRVHEHATQNTSRAKTAISAGLRKWVSACVASRVARYESQHARLSERERERGEARTRSKDNGFFFFFFFFFPP
jgi:hypothetical protein